MNFFNKFEKLKMKYKDSPNMVISFLLATISILFIFVGGTYALVFDNSYTESINKITTGNLVLQLQNSTPVININDAVPMSDKYALINSVPYRFTLENTGGSGANYKVTIVSDCVVGNTYTVGSNSVVANLCVPMQYIKIAVMQDDDDYVIITPDENGEIILAANYLDINDTSSTYSLKVWLDEDTPNTYNDSSRNVIVSLRLRLYNEQSIVSAEPTFLSYLEKTVGDSGLVSITHPADDTLQLGATTPITEYRYQGANPNNYVNFNGESGDYRIIGVFPTDDGTGNITNRIKLIKTTNYGNNYWNNSTNNNKWGEANLNTTLNDTYYNSLTNKGLIDNVKYYLGGYKDFTFTNETMYQYERKISGSDYYYSGNPTSWTGQIGLMYVSDYMYGSADCNGKVGYDSSTTDTRACKTTNWLYLGSNEWTIAVHSSDSNIAFLVRSGGRVGYSYVGSFSYGVRPVFYLNPSAIVYGGNGTLEHPYLIRANEN